jgi:hypothetical protein
MSEVKMGGKPKTRILALGGQDVLDVLVSRNDGGTKLTKGLKERAAERFGDKVTIELVSEPGATLEALAGWKAPADLPDVVLVSTLSDVTGQGRMDVSQLHEHGKNAIRALKGSGAHIFVMNISTVDPNDAVTNYFGLENDTAALRAHKVALTLIDLSHELGISIIDSDRLLAEMGAERHVESVGRYSAEASEVLCEEILRVLADYGFFEERPLVVQAGRGGS